MTTTNAEISARLRSIRRTRGLTLSDVERESKGVIKAIALGSYERGDRCLSISKAIVIANHYQLPLAYLLTGQRESKEKRSSLIIDVYRLKKLIAETQSEQSITTTIIYSFLTGIIKKRQDFNAQVLSLRESDCHYLTMILGCSTNEILEILDERKLRIVLNTK